MTTRVECFLRDNGFVHDAEFRSAVTAAYESEIAVKLAGGKSSLYMLDSYIPGEVEADRCAPVAVVDAGGTNLRVAVADFNNVGVAFRNVHKTFMPGSRGPLSADAFHQAIADKVDAVFASDSRIERLGYCFSYGCRSFPDRDAELLAWSKQIDAPDVIGQRVGAELVRRMSRRPVATTVLNDTVATLLAGRAVSGRRHFSGYLGFILGTGTNVACVEEGSIRNAESGEFDKLPQSAFDQTFDAGLPDCGMARFEKMVAGGYLGGIGLQMLKAAGEAGLFAGDSGRLNELRSLETKDLDAFAVGRGGSANPLAPLFSGADVEVARALATCVFKRAAILTAAHLAAFLKRAAPASEKDPVCITVDGSTFWKTQAIDFNAEVTAELSRIPEVPTFEIVRVEDAPMLGAAVAATL